MNSKKLDYSLHLAKDTWTILEAACLISEVSPSDREIIDYDGYSNPVIQQQKVQDTFDTINTWSTSYSAHPFTYIDAAIKKCLLEEIPDHLLSSIKKIISRYSPEERTEFINQHPSLATQLNLIKQETVPNEKPLHESERRALAKMILGMAVEKYDYNPNSPKNTATGTNSGSIKASIELIGYTIDNDTIKNHLEKAVSLLEYKTENETE